MDYSDLKQAVEDWLNKPEIVEAIPTFIALAEARFNRELRVNSMLARSTASVSSGYVDLPSDWLQHSSLVVTTGNENGDAFLYVSPEEYHDLRNKGITGTARYYTIVGGRIALLPVPSGATTVEGVYYRRIPALSATNQSNWLIERSPDLYLYGSLLAAEPYLQNDARVAMWAAGVSQVLEAMRMESERSMRPSGALSARRRTFG
jgi:hypothetical protein